MNVMIYHAPPRDTMRIGLHISECTNYISSCIELESSKGSLACLPYMQASHTSFPLERVIPSGISSTIFETRPMFILLRCPIRRCQRQYISWTSFVFMLSLDILSVIAFSLVLSIHTLIDRKS